MFAQGELRAMSIAMAMGRGAMGTWGRGTIMSSPKLSGTRATMEIRI